MSPKVWFIAFLDQILSSIPSFSRAVTHSCITRTGCKEASPLARFLQATALRHRLEILARHLEMGEGLGQETGDATWYMQRLCFSIFFTCLDMFQSTCRKLGRAYAPHRLGASIVSDGAHVNEWLFDGKNMFGSPCQANLLTMLGFSASLQVTRAW